MHDVEHISIYIHRLPDDVYAFASNPENLPRWATGLASSEVKRVGDAWVAEAPFGTVRIKFAEANTFGVMDHDIEGRSIRINDQYRVCFRWSRARARARAEDLERPGAAGSTRSDPHPAPRHR